MWWWRRLPATGLCPPPPARDPRGALLIPKSAEKLPGLRVTDSERAGWPGGLNGCSAGPRWTPASPGWGGREGTNDRAGMGAPHTTSPERGCGVPPGEGGIGLGLGLTCVPGGACHRDRAGGRGGETQTDRRTDRQAGAGLDSEPKRTSVTLRSDLFSDQARFTTATFIGSFAVAGGWTHRSGQRSPVGAATCDGSMDRLQAPGGPRSHEVPGTHRVHGAGS